MSYRHDLFTLHTPNVERSLETLNDIGSDLTERIGIAEAAGDFSTVDELLKLKIINNQRKARYVISSTRRNCSSTGTDKSNGQASPA